MANLDIVNIGKRFGSVTVIDDLNLSINDGEFLVLVGPSGCGKSTLLRMIAGLETISSGDLLIDGKIANELPPQKRNMAMVFQSYALFPHMTVRDNICFGPQVRGDDPQTTELRLQEAAALLNLTPFLDRKPASLSGGQRQRVAMGRSIMRDPSVFLFDEPLSNLDAKLRVQMRTEIKALHQRLEATTVYVTHDQIEAMTMADRIVVMNEGKIEQVGTPMALYDKPANQFVASFIGSPAMSFFNARKIQKNETLVAELSDGSQLAMELMPGITSENIVIGVRPESFVRDTQGPLSLEVEVVEPTGPEVQVFGTIANHPTRVIFREKWLPSPGDSIRLSVAASEVHVFDAELGSRWSQ